METCSICVDEIEEFERVLSCNHVFHHACIEEWLQKKQECPLCQSFQLSVKEWSALVNTALYATTPKIDDKVMMELLQYGIQSQFCPWNISFFNTYGLAKKKKYSREVVVQLAKCGFPMFTNDPAFEEELFRISREKDGKKYPPEVLEVDVAERVKVFLEKETPENWNKLELAVRSMIPNVIRGYPSALYTSIKNDRVDIVTLLLTHHKIHSWIPLIGSPKLFANMATSDQMKELLMKSIDT
jgi:hypothetical protein